MKTQRYFYFFLWDSELVLIFVVASLFKDMEDNKWLIYGLGFTSSILALIAGLVLTNKKKEDK